MVIRLERIISIMEHRTRELSDATREFLQLAEVEGKLEDISTGTPKSFVLTDEKVYLSPISSVTLRRRAEALRGFGFLEFGRGL